MNIERLLQQGALQQAYKTAQVLLLQCQQSGENAYAVAAYDIAMAYLFVGRILRKSGAAIQAQPYLQEAQLRFESTGDVGYRMASVSLTEQGNCLRDLGQLVAAEVAYEQAIQRDEKLECVRDLAAGKGQLATIRMLQNRYTEALQGYREVLHLFTQLGEPISVANTWHQIGMVHLHSGNHSQAEQAYRQSLSINNQIGNRAGEANSLAGLGSLYVGWKRPEQAVSFYRQAGVLYVQQGNLRNEGFVCNNLAATLIQLGRYDEARPELLRAIECGQAFDHAAQLWDTWQILHDLEQSSGNPQAAREAQQQALAAYLAYRRDGGKNNEGSGQLCRMMLQAIQSGETEEIGQKLAQIADRPDMADKKAFVQKLQAVLAGERDLALAEDEKLHYQYAAELVLLLEELQEAGI